MAVSDFLGYLLPLNPFSTAETKGKSLSGQSEGVSFLPSKEVRVLKPDQLKRVDQSLALSNFFAILGGVQNLIQFVTTGIEAEGRRAYRFFSEHYYSYRLKTALEKGFKALTGETVPSQDGSEPSEEISRLDAELKTQLPAKDISAFLSDETQLKALSHLRRASSSGHIDSEVFEAIFHGKGTYCPEVLQKVVSYVKDFLPKSLLEDSKLKAVDKAIVRDKAFRNQVEEGKGQSSHERKGKLRDLAGQMVRDVNGLLPGESYVAIAGVHHSKGLESPLIDSILSQFLPQDLHALLKGNDSEKVVHDITKRMKNAIWGDETETPGMGKKVEQAIRRALSKANFAVETVLPEMVLDGIKNSLQQDLEEILMGPPKEGSAERLGEQLWEDLKAKGIEKVLQDGLLDALEKSRFVIEAQMESVNEKVMSSLPAAARPILAASGLPRGEDEAVWFEFEKQDNGKFKLTLFAEGASASSHPTGKVGDEEGIQLPLTYSDLDLDEAFFYTLLSYRAVPEWDSNVCFTVQNIHDGLIASLKKEPDHPTSKSLVPLEDLQGEGVWKYVSRYLGSHLNIDADEFESLYSYNLRMQAFVQMWAHVQDDPNYLTEHPVIAQRFKSALSELTDQGLMLYEKKQLCESDLKALYATVWEAQQVLKVEKPQPKTASSVIVPPDLQELAKKLVLAVGVSPTQISMLKEALMVVYGADIEDVVDQAFRDVLPTLTTDEMNQARALRSSDNLYTVEGLKRTAKQLKNFRFSVFHFVRLYVSISKVMSDLFSASMASRFVEFLILAYFPAILGYTSMSVGTLSKVIVCFGPSVLKPILPDPLYQTFRSSYKLIKEVMTYVQRRLLFATVRIVARFLLGGEKASKLSAQARNWNQKITRSGELSYSIPYGKNDIGHFRVKPLEKAVSFLETEKAGVEKPTVSCKLSSYGSTSELPRPGRVKITKDNLHQELTKWALEAEVLGSDQGLGRSEKSCSYQRLLYINRQFRNLKLPSETTLWDEVDPIQTMKLLRQVITSMGRSGVVSADEQAELVTTTYTAYALMDHLARRVDEARLPSELKANGCELAIWLQSPASRVIRKDTYEQLEKTAHYFGFDIEKVYTEEEIDQRRTGCFFNYEGEGERWFVPAFGGGSDFNVTYRGFQFSKEGGYYKQLLRDPAIQAKLETAGVDPKVSEWEKFKELFCGTGGALPDAFAMLRDIDQRARGCVTSSRLDHQKLEFSRSDGGMYWQVIDKVINCFHFCTASYFRNQTFDSGFNGLLSTSVTRQHKDDIALRIYRRGNEHFISNGKLRLADRHTQYNLLIRKKIRTVDEVMAQDPLQAKDLSSHEARLLELINCDKEDQVMGTLGFFRRNMGRLREPRFRVLFDLYLNRLGALPYQLKQKSDLPDAIGLFFKDALEQFDRQEDIETCLFLTKIGQEIEQVVGSLSPDAFPDFRGYIRFHLIPNLRSFSRSERSSKFSSDSRQDLILISYYHLILSYGSKNPAKITEEERKQAVEDIARLVYTCLNVKPVEEATKSDVMVKADEVLFIWEPYIKKAMENDSALRKEVIESVLRDVGMGSMIEEEDSWTGTYPVFTNGRITLDLTQKTHSTHEISLELATKKAAEVALEPGAGVRLNERSFSFPDKKVIIEFPEGVYKGDAPAIVYRQFAGIDYEYIPSSRQELYQAGSSFHLNKEETLWLERPRFGRTRHLLCMKGEEKLWKRPVRKATDSEGKPIFEVRWNRQVIDGVPVREVNLSDEPHGLALLNWFEDEKEIKAFAHASNPDELAFITIPKWDLRFAVREHGGELQAMALGDKTGYFLSKVQRHEHLLKYGKYLLMENSRGKKKVYMATRPLKGLMADFVIGNLGGIQSSPLIEHYINAFSPDILQQESQLLSFDLDSNGNLVTSDPMGLAYLALFNFIRGDREASLHYFSQVEEFGRKHPFPPKMYRIFELMYLPLLCAQDRFSREMALRIGAIQSENQLIQHSEETGHSTVPKEEMKTTQLLRWILLQVKYKEYLKAVKSGVPATLSDFQELFLLTEMGRANKTYYNDYVGKTMPVSLQVVGKKVGLEHVANATLFFPEVMERYHELRLQLDNNSGLSSISRGLVVQAVNAAFSPGSQTGGAKQLHGGLNTLSRAVEHAKNSALMKSLVHSYNLSSFHEKVEVYPDLSTLPTAIWELDQENLIRYFPLYYRLARNERSWGTDKALFNRKRDELLRSLELMQGHFSDDVVMRREILQVVARGSKVFSFASARQLENAILRMQKADNADQKEVSAFQEFLSNQIIYPCRNAQFSNGAVQAGLKAKSWNAVKTFVDTGIYLVPGFLLPPTVEAAQCGYELTAFAKAAVKKEPHLLHRGLRVAAKTGSVAIRMLAPQYGAAIWGLKALPWMPRAWTLKKSVDYEKARETKPSNAVTSRSRSELRDKRLDSEIAKNMKNRDAAINRAFDDIFDEFYNAENLPLQIDPSSVDSYKAESDDKLLDQAFDEINQSLKAYYKRSPERELQVELKKGKDPQKFVERVKELTQYMAKHLEEEERKIAELVQAGKKQSADDHGAQIVHKINRQRFGEEGLTFKEIYALFTSADDEAFLRRTELSPDHWEDLKLRLYYYQIMRRRFNMLFNQVDQMKKGEFNTIDQLALELKRRPAYDLGQDVPELVLRSKLSYEVALEFMLYETALQSAQLDALLLEKTKKAVSEQIMGTGKTFLVPISDRVFADGKTLVCNTVIDSVAPSNFNFFTRSTKKAFDQGGSILRFNRSMTWTTEQLWGLRLMLKRALYMGEHVNARQKDWQALDLRRLEECLDDGGKFLRKYGEKEWDLRQQYYCDCLDLLDVFGLEDSDEKHELDRPDSNILNFPLGPRMTLQDEEIEIMNEIMLLLLTVPEFKEYITIKAKRPEKLSVAIYRDRIKEVLSKRVAALELFDIPEKDHEVFATYLRGEATTIPAFTKKHPRRRAIGQAKGCITVLLEHALQSVINVDFTVSQKEGNGEFTRPAEGNNSPLEDSTDLKPDINYIRTLMRLFQTRLTPKQLEKLLEYLHEEAADEEKKRGLQKQKTLAGRFFSLHCPGFQIDTYKPADLPKIMDMLNKSDRAMTIYAKRFIAKEIKFYKSFLSSNFANFHSLFGKGQRSRTGTPKNWRMYPQGTKVLSHPGTVGESVHVLEKKIGAASIHVLQENDPKPALREVIYRFFHPNPKALALIDLDPLCNNMSSEEINGEFQAYITEHRPELQGVAFYDKDKKLVVAEKGSKQFTPFEECNIPKDQRISIFSHTQTTGSDIPQDNEAEAILTIGENITLTDLAQAFDRMRKARRGKQKVTIVMTKRAQQKICKRLGVSPDHVPTMREITRIAAENEEQKLDPLYYLAACYLLHDIIRKAFDRKARQQPSVAKMAEVIRKHRDVFVTEVETNPIEAYGHIDIMADPQVVLADYKRSLSQKILDNTLFTMEEIAKILEELNSVQIDYSKGKVHMYDKNGQVDGGDALLSQHAHQAQDQNADNENHQSSEVDTDTHVNVNQKAAPPPEKKPMNEQTHYGYSWPEGLDPYDVDSYFREEKPNALWCSSAVPIYSFKNLLGRRKDLAYLRDSVSSSIYVSENYAQQRDNRWINRADAIKPLGERQSPLYKALVIQDHRSGKLQQKILLLHKDEIAFWRKKLENCKTKHPMINIALFDFGTRTFMGDEMERNADFKHAITQIKFLNAELAYDKEEQETLLGWIRGLGAKQMRTTFEQLHKERPVGSTSGSDVQTLFYIAAGVPLDMRIKV